MRLRSNVIGQILPKRYRIDVRRSVVHVPHATIESDGTKPVLRDAGSGREAAAKF